MARRKARVPQGKKLQPAVKTLAFQIPAGVAGRDDTIDLSQCASLLNRRFYRQGLNWAVAGFTFFTTGTGGINIYKIPDTWVASNAWHKGFSHWQEMNQNALDSSESVKPRFLDFKVFMDETHHASGVGANLLPVDSAGTAATPGEWAMSTYVIPDTDSTSNEREVVWTGANYPGNGASGLNAVSLIEGYAASRGLPDIRDPNAPVDASDAFGATPENWLSGLDSEGVDQDETVLENMIADNNEAPYPFENGTNPAGGVFADTQYPGGANQLPGLQVHDSLLVTGTTVGGKTSAPGGNFQGGFIRINNTIDTGIVALLVHLVPGGHRGYMCQPMQDV